ncbi:MAG TPA: DUF4153 domain-containing protein [Gemmatimonadaceae bacterium]|nr:DUF4153 domain-containing protein [Gemmatimonadaceae bacterium]
MRLPALGDVVSTAQRNLTRFPLVILAGAIVAYAGLAMVETTVGDPDLLRLMAAASLGLPLFFGLTVFAERRAPTRIAYWAVQAAGLAIVVAFWRAWPAWTEDMRGARFLQLLVAFHLFVAFAPFAGRDEPRAFWQFNRILFVRFLLTAFYTVVLWVGLSGALLAVDKLLGVSVASEAYARLWVVLAFVFNPWFFVSGVPADIGALEAVDDYPRGLRVFTQYVLVPIVTLYLAILTVYFAKVLVTREWPNGWIGNLVSSVAGAGILSWLLVHPLEGDDEHAWVKTFTRGFYLAMMPAIVMLWLAIWKRVQQYGITERRYFLVVLSVWFAGVAAYYTLTRSRNIKLVPVTLCAVALLSFAGPWGAYGVSLASQRARLSAVLTANGLLVDGVLRPSSRPVPAADVREISEGFRYLLQAHGTSAVRPWVAGEVARDAGAVGSGTHARADAGARAIVAAIGLQYTGGSVIDAANYFSYFTERRTDAVAIDGYAYAMLLSPGLARDTVAVADGIRLTAAASPPALVVLRGAVPVLTVPLQPAIDTAAAIRRTTPTGAIPRRVMTLQASAGDARALVVLTQVAGTRTRGVVTLTGLEGEIYLRVP